MGVQVVQKLNLAQRMAEAMFGTRTERELIARIDARLKRAGAR